MESATRSLLEQCFLCLVLLVVRSTETTTPPDGFKFNCIQDICVFPRDYCNMAGTPHCDECTLDVCNELDVSSQCGQRCKELKGEVELSAPGDQSVDGHDTLTDPRVTILWYAVWILVALAILWFVIRIIKCVIAYRKSTRNKQSGEGDSTQEYQQLPARHDDQYTDVNADDRPNPTAPPQPPVSSGRPLSTGSSVSVYQPSPSGQAGNYSTRGNYRLLPDTISESPAESQPQVDHHQLHPVEDHHVSDMGDFHLLDGAGSTGVDADATVVKGNAPSDSSNHLEVVPEDIDRQAPQRNRSSNNQCEGMFDAYMDKDGGRTVPRVSSTESVISSASRGSDSGNYSSGNSSETDNIANGKRRCENENILMANV